LDLMRYLCKLITPKGGCVVDPFTGSGTTGCAAALENFNFVGIEKDLEYQGIAMQRIEQSRLESFNAYDKANGFTRQETNLKELWERVESKKVES
jgi:DNA modification methylase